MTYNKHLCEQVRKGLLAIENTDKEKLADLIHHIFPDDNQLVYGTSKFYLKSILPGKWTDFTEVNPSIPTLPVSSFLAVQNTTDHRGKAEQLVERFQIELDGVYGDAAAAKQCALIAQQRVIEALENIGWPILWSSIQKEKKLLEAITNL